MGGGKLFLLPYPTTSQNIISYEKEYHHDDGAHAGVCSMGTGTEDDWNSIQSYCWSCGTIYVGHELEINSWDGWNKIIFGSMGENRLCWVKVWVADGQESGKICIFVENLALY